MGIADRIWSYDKPTSEGSDDNALSQRLRDLVGADTPAAAQSDTQAQADRSQKEPASEPAPPAVAAAPAGKQSQAVVSPAPEREQRPEMADTKDKANATPPAPVSSSNEPGRQFVERFQAAVNRADGNAEKRSGSNWQAPPEFQNIQKQFETDFRKRLDGALVEFERRVSSKALVDDVAGQVEQRIRLAANDIFKEVKDQAWKMHSAVAGELRSFRDQFAKEIEDRIAMLDRATQQAIQTQGKLEETLPNAEDSLRLLLASGQQASARLEETSKNLEERLRAFQQDASGQIASQKESLDALAQSLHQDGLQLQEQMEKFRGEAGEAREALGRAADQTLERLNAGAEEANARVRETREEMGRAADQSLEKLNAGAEEASVRVREAGEAMGRATDQSLEKLNAGAEAASGRVREAREELGRAADQSLEKLNAGAEAANTRVREAREEMGRAADQSLEKLNADAEAASARVREAREEMGRATDQSLEKLNVAADEVSARARDEVEKVTAEIERRVLSGGLVERATEQLGKATEEIVTPSLERLRNASQGADSAAESLAGASQRVTGQLDEARQRIEARLDNLLGEQLGQLETGMSDFQRKAGEELGSMVERVVEQSTSELDQRLHGLLQDLFVTTNKQINTAARATLTNMQEGFKEAFTPQTDDSAPESGATQPPAQSSGD